MRVAETVLRARVVDQEILAAAVLHDCLEDENVKGFTMHPKVIEDACGAKVLRWVQLLSNTETGNRAQRKMKAAQRIAGAPWQVQAIKIADIIDNCTGVTDCDPRFAETYIAEKRTLLDMLVPTHEAVRALRAEALDVLAAEMNKLAVFALENGRAMEAERIADDQLIADLLAEEENSIYAEVALF
jgi:(p)ppGpp synthase/HD superfamily hydrolase